MVNLKTRPFCLDQEAIDWVEETLAGMSLEEKAGQVFCPMGFSDDTDLLLRRPDLGQRDLRRAHFRPTHLGQIVCKIADHLPQYQNIAGLLAGQNVPDDLPFDPLPHETSKEIPMIQ